MQSTQVELPSQSVLVEDASLTAPTEVHQSPLSAHAQQFEYNEDTLSNLRGVRCYSSNSSVGWQLYSMVSKHEFVTGEPTKLDNSKGSSSSTSTQSVEAKESNTKSMILLGVLVVLGVYFVYGTQIDQMFFGA